MSKSLSGILIVNILWLLAIFVMGFTPLNISFQHGSFVLACFDIAFVLRHWLACRNGNCSKE